MAKYNVTQACGCRNEFALFGKSADRQAKIDWLGTVDCAKCAAKKAKTQAENEGLPVLQGSVKQVAWAAKIRQELLIKAADAGYTDMKALRVKQSASWWIDNRGMKF